MTCWLKRVLLTFAFAHYKNISSLNDGDDEHNVAMECTKQPPAITLSTVWHLLKCLLDAKLHTTLPRWQTDAKHKQNIQVSL
jgi:hypothetical protein